MGKKVIFTAEIEFEDEKYFEAFKVACLNHDPAKEALVDGCLSGLNDYFWGYDDFRGMASIEHSKIASYSIEEAMEENK